MNLMLRALLVGLLVQATIVTDAHAKTMRVVSRAKHLPTAVLARLCERGLVALIESHPDGTSRQVVLFARLPASPERVYDVLMDVETYPKYLNTIDKTAIIGRRKNMLGFSWALDLPLIALEGTRLQRGLRPKLIESRGRTGNLRGTRERWELYPIEGGTLVAFYRALDIETGGFVLRTLVELEPSSEAGANLSSSFVHLRGLERHLAGLPAAKTLPKARTGPVHAFHPLDLQNEAPLETVRSLLAFGQLAVIESFDDGALRQVALLGHAHTSTTHFRAVVADPARYPDFMPNISRQTVKQLPSGALQLDWTIKTPVSSISGRAEMKLSPERIEVLAVRGDVERARIQWEFLPIGPDRVVPVYYSYSDIRTASWVTRQLLKAEPLLEHGMVAAAGTVALTAMTARAEGRR